MVLFVQASPFFDRGVMKSRGSRLNCLRRIGYALLVTIFCLSSTTSTSPFSSNNNNSTYVERCRADCASHKDLITCGKFRVVRWLNDIAREKVGLVEFFSTSRVFSNFSSCSVEWLLDYGISCTSSERKVVHSLFIIRKQAAKNEAIFSTRYFSRKIK